MDIYLKTPPQTLSQILKTHGFKIKEKQKYFDARLKTKGGRIHMMYAILDKNLYCDLHFDYWIHFLFIGVDYSETPKIFFSEKLLPLLIKHNISFSIQEVSWFTRRNKAKLFGYKIARNVDIKRPLEHVKNTYHIWGQHPFLYRLACIITFLGRENKLRKLAVKILELKKGDIVLDLACGTGLNHKFLEDVIGPNGKIIAFDYSNEMLAAAKQQAKENDWNNITFIRGDAAQLLLNTRVDGVLSTLGISAIPQHQEALKRAINVLKKNKRISILDAQLPSGFWRTFNPIIAYVYKRWASWNYKKNIPKDLSQLIHNTQTKYFNGGTIYITFGEKT